jgi:type IV pilus assembly protein PilN
MPVHLLNEITRQLPNGVYLTTLRQQNQVVTITGTAQSNERVSELLRNFANNSPWLTRPELVEIVAGNVALSPRDQRRVSNFTVRVQLRRPSEVAHAASAAASAASTPVRAASASSGAAAIVASAASAPGSAASVARAAGGAGSSAVVKP